MGMIAGKSMYLVCGRNRKGVRMTKYQEAGCSRGWMQQLEMNAGRPTVARRYAGTCSRCDEDEHIGKFSTGFG